MRKGHVGLCKAPTMEERKNWKAKRRQISYKFIDLGFERWQVAGFKKLGKTVTGRKLSRQFRLKFRELYSV